ncbi:hypothetical protein, partial [Streptomyces sp. AK02-04a]|uniref:hypothetical protein n=1 Tax=Streptomyces sp. AK02-04a TaxID=3028649 RepID=UPI0029B25454
VDQKPLHPQRLTAPDIGCGIDGPQRGVSEAVVSEALRDSPEPPPIPERFKTPMELFIGWDLRHRWSGNGTAQKSDFGGKSLRDMYLSVHEGVLGLLDDLDTVAAEIADPKRRSWFLRETPGNYPYDLGVGWYRACYAEKVAKAKAEGWPDMTPEWLRRSST